MKILIVSESIPFPARNGRELPIANIFSELSKRHTIDFLVASGANDQDYLLRKKNAPEGVNFLKIATKKIPTYKLILNEIKGKSPIYFSETYDLAEIKKLFKDKVYDIVWVSPVGKYSLIYFLKKHHITIGKKYVIGLNDVKTTLYLDSLEELKSGHYGFKLNYITDYLRVPFIRRCERKYLNDADAVHVQTPLEKQRAKDVLKNKSNVKIIVAQNGIKEELLHCSYKGIDSNKILYMTHLSGGRKEESTWFLKKVWPEIMEQNKDAVMVMVGTPPDKSHWLYGENNQRIEIVGYADDLTKVYDSVAIAIIPIIHSTGIINRALDALIAGVPVVGSRQALNTINGIKFNKNALAANSIKEYKRSILSLLENSNLRKELSQAGRTLGKSHPTWQETSHVIENELKDL